MVRPRRRMTEIDSRKLHFSFAPSLSIFLVITIRQATNTACLYYCAVGCFPTLSLPRSLALSLSFGGLRATNYPYETADVCVIINSQSLWGTPTFATKRDREIIQSLSLSLPRPALLSLSLYFASPAMLIMACYRINKTDSHPKGVGGRRARGVV